MPLLTVLHMPTAADIDDSDEVAASYVWVVEAAPAEPDFVVVQDSDT